MMAIAIDGEAADYERRTVRANKEKNFTRKHLSFFVVSPSAVLCPRFTSLPCATIISALVASDRRPHDWENFQIPRKTLERASE